MEYDNTNRGRLFKNDRKEKENHPDYKGEINIEGKNYELAAWIKESQQGRKFISMSVKEKVPYDKSAAKPAMAKPAPQKYEGRKADDEGDEIPF